MQNERKSAGELYWCLYPLTDKIDKTKRRPVLIISNNISNQLDDDYIVIPLTKAIREEPFSIIVSPTDIIDGHSVTGELRCNKPFTVRNNLFAEGIGRLHPQKVYDAIDMARRAIEFDSSTFTPRISLRRK